MILEALQHLFLRCPPSLKRLGVLHGLIALQQRANRQKRAWKPHIEACQQATRAMIATHCANDPQHQRRRLAVVLGSGLLLEVPIADLATAFERVVCLDLYHMPSAHKRAKPYPNVTLRAHDITGLFEGFPDSVFGGLPTPRADFGPALEADFVLSANCLSQLSGTPIAIAAAVGGHRPDHIVEWERAFIATHLNGLRACPGTVGLIADSRRETLSVRTGELLDWMDLSHGVPWPDLADAATWWWDLAPAPEEGRAVSIRHRVTAGRIVSER